MQAINNLRGIAILMIVFTHAIWTMPQVGPVGEFLDYCIGSGTVVFMFIAGYLFAVQSDGFQYGPYLRSKLLYVVLPYLIVSFPAAMLYVTGAKSYHEWIPMHWFLHDLNPVERYLYIVSKGGMLGPLWFIPMVILFYIASPLFVVVRRSSLLAPLFLVSLVFACMISRPPLDDNAFQSFLFFMPAFLLGMVLQRHYVWIVRALPYALPIGLAYLTLFALLYFIAYDDARRPDFPDTLVLYMPLIVAVLLLVARYWNRHMPFLDLCARLSFYIFFIHGYFSGVIRVAMRRAGDHVFIGNPVIELATIIASGVLILVLCFGAYVVLKLLTGSRSRYLIGA